MIFASRQARAGAISVPRAARSPAKAPSSSSRPIRPAKIGSTPTPLTTLASRIFTPIQPSPWNRLEARTGTMRGRSMLEPSTTRLASPPVACASGLQHVGRGGDFRKFLRVGRPDIDQRLQRAVGRLPQAEFVRGKWSRAIRRVRRRSSVSSRVAPEGEVTVTGVTLSAMVWRITCRSLPCTCSRSASSSRSGCFISQCDIRRSRSRCGPPPS